MAQGTTGSILVMIWTTVWIRESEVRNPDSLDSGVRRRSAHSEHFYYF